MNKNQKLLNNKLDFLIFHLIDIEKFDNRINYKKKAEENKEYDDLEYADDTT